METSSKTIFQLLRTAPSQQEVAVNGWIRTKRDAKGFSFIELNDGSCLSNLQVIVDASLPNYREIVQPLTTGSSIHATGVLTESPGKGQTVELHAHAVTVYTVTPPDYPLQKKRHSFEFLRDIAHLRPRTNALGAVSRIRSSLSYAVHSFFQERNFHYVHTPIITASDCEGAGEMFRVTTLDHDQPPRTQEGMVDYSEDFFGRQAFLTVSGQLEAEIYAMAMGRVYTFGPTFRAENSNTSRHLAEFWMIEPEVAFCNLCQDMDLAEQFVRFLARWSLERCAEDLELFNARVDKTVIQTLEKVAAESFERLAYTDAVKILEESNQQFEYAVHWGSDLQTEHERHLTETVFKKPVIVYDYPKEIKAFYMKANEDGKTVRAMDLLVPRIGELIGGSEREDDHDQLVCRIKQNGMREEDYWWYLELRKFGGAPHAGFGLGFERLLLFVTGMQNIRDVIPFPRYPKKAEF
ncbi:MAG: asparagine--tRNA ligase [Chitinivibrionales bacterium]